MDLEIYLEVSHGRGGAGNIKPDDTPYGDGEVVRAGPEGSHADGAFSTGRGGAANIGDAGKTAPSRKDVDIVPETAMRPSSENTDYHTGRGGAGNEHLAHHGDGAPGKEHATRVADGAVSPKGLADKLKQKAFGGFGKK
ncbi:hypothetical protein GE09DRAFT_1167584 [Coniochaeta sp. 2T2.1]|nr:hypothetical protein GE09DRAFT_1167584 [Coniochaeta sp. 2T2.1]